MMMLWIYLFLEVASAGNEIWLEVGETRKIPAAATAEVRVGTRGVVRAVDTPTGLHLIALKPGSTTLSIGIKAYKVLVSGQEQKRFLSALKSNLTHMMGLRLVMGQTMPEVRGTLLRFSDWERLAALADQFGGQYRFSAKALPRVGEEALVKFTQIARRQGTPILRFSASPQFTVHVPRTAKGLRTEVERIFSSYGVQVEDSTTDLLVEPQVRTRVVLAELSKNQFHEFGVEWPTQYQAQLLPKPQASESLMVSLKALEARGQAQILAAPTLLCRSGGQAEFHAGGEFPVRVRSRQQQDVVWKRHGVLLQVKPKADFHGTISLELQTEVSLIDMGQSVDGIPSLRKNQVKSQFDLTGKRTVALSGLLRQELGEARDGLPLLSRLPILGPLFASDRYLRHQTELVIFVTPEIFSPQSNERLEMPKGWIQHEF